MGRRHDGERFALVVGSDLIYDPGVVEPLITTTAAASLAPGGRFVLAQSFALGDASSRALDEACGAHKLALEVVESAGEARVGDGSTLGPRYRPYRVVYVQQRGVRQRPARRRRGSKPITTTKHRSPAASDTSGQSAGGVSSKGVARSSQ